jgi:hypothetical protein
MPAAARLVAAGAIFFVSLLTMFGVVGEILVESSLYSDTSCGDPARPSESVFGDARWSRWPPGSYCDYRRLHPDWPARVAVTGRPSPIRGVLLVVAPLTSALSGAYLWSAIKRHRGDREPHAAFGEYDDIGYLAALTAMEGAGQTSTASSAGVSSSEVETGTS